LIFKIILGLLLIYLYICNEIINTYINSFDQNKAMKRIKACIYARVSTKGQEFERQLAELRQYAEKMGYEVVMEFSEKISGAKKVEEREALIGLLSYVEANPVDKVLIYECSRLSRRAVDFLSVIETLTALKVSVYIHQNGLETLLPNGTPNPIAQLVLGILAQFNSMERSLIRSRMESGYNHFRSIGGKVGRKKGYRKSDQQILDQYQAEVKLLRKGLSLRNVQAITHTSINTLRKIKSLI
jgi:DNA invertase Pin-like site-specific DNA recombinase